MLRASTVVAIACATMVAACADVAQLGSDECGNGVVETGEDCDGYPAHDEPGLACGTEPARACRYICDRSTGAPVCPTGWACGADGVCSHPSGAFAPSSGSQVFFDVDDWEVHDVNGDGRPDLTGFRQTAVAVRFGDGAGEFPNAFELASPHIFGKVAVGDLDGDGRADAVVPVANGLNLLRGTPQALEPAPAVMDSLLWGAEHPATLLRFDSFYFTIHDLIVIYATDDATVVESTVDQLIAPPPKVVLPEYRAIVDLITPLVTANIDRDPADRSDELILTFRGDDTVWIVGQSLPLLPLRLELRAQVPLPGMTIDKGATTGDVDGDGNLDLLISVANDQVAVALGDGQGGFGPATIDARFDALLAIDDPPGLVRDWYDVFQRWPLLVADFNADGVADYVSPNGVYLTNPGTNQLRQVQWRYFQPAAWERAVSGDFDGDGIADLAAIASPTAQQGGVEIFYGGIYSSYRNLLIGTAGKPHLLRAGDFDGDGVTDLAVVERQPLGGADSLSILYGDRGAGAGPPVSMGSFHHIFEMSTGIVREAASLIPGFTHDIHLRGTTLPSRMGSPVFTTLFGSAQRQLASPYLLRDPNVQYYGDRLHEIIVGKFVAEQPHTSVITIGQGLPDPGDDIARLWLFPGTDGVRLDGGVAYPHAVTNALGDSSCAARGVLLLTIDVDANGTDEFVAVDQSDGCETHGLGASPAPRLVVGRITDTRGFALTGLGVPGDFRVPYQLERADMDGDGYDDVIVTFAGEYLASAGSLARGAGVVIYWNDAGALSTSSTSIVIIPPGVEHVVSAVPINVDAEVGSELAVLTDVGVFVCKLDGRAVTTPCQRVVDTGLRRTKGGGERLRVADVNNDGLDDLLLGRAGQIEVYLAVRHFDTR